MSNEEKLQKKIASGDMVIAFFTGQWCRHCQPVRDIMKFMMRKNHTSVEMLEFDVQNSNELANQYGVRSLPTILFFKNHRVINMLTGSSEGLERYLQSFLDGSAA